ncbi:uncharacterized protein JCM6883_005831 [Sporobolomyces salmoneus]|uniref:uncharacterized protein n=1 Tax=Sporobolomyces salmoneus TaxID=183962 RepID=UPI00317D086C
MNQQQRLLTFSVILATFLSSSSVVSALPGRFPCGTTSPNQQICDALSPASSPRTVGVPVGSECVAEKGLGYFCGWQGATCTADSQCDFGQCTGFEGNPGICVGGLGDLCEGPDGPDDTLCAGNLGCQRTTSEGIVGKAVCGGSGADCSFEGAYQIGTRPNHSACISKHCSKRSLTCSTPNRPSPGRPQILFDTAPANPKLSTTSSSSTSNQRNSKIVVPSGSSCPTGFTVCPVARPGGRGFEMACFDTTNSATHCGGCPAIGAGFWSADQQEGGKDCTTMPGVASSDCIDSKCRVFSCSPNYDFDRLTGTCKPKKYW